MLKDQITDPFDGAVWIEAPWRGGAFSSAPVPVLHQEFLLPAPPKSATLSITALGLFEAEINGRPVCDHVFAPGWTNYHRRVRYLRLDVTSLVVTGPNAIGVLLGDGWYCGHIAMNLRQNYGEQPRFLARLDWETVDGTRGAVVSEGSWRCSQGPIREADLLMGEAYDAQLEIPGWSQPGLNTANWWPVRIWTPPPGLELSLHEDPPVRRMETLPGREISRAAWGFWRRYDFGVNLAGRVRIRARGPRGATIVIRHAEMLDADGSLYTDNLRSARATDAYTFRGDGVEIWEPRFTFHGFRYCEVSSPLHRGIEIESVDAVVLHNDLPRTGDFFCSHELINRLYANIVRSQRGNYLEVPTDCPQRDERLGWTGDAQVFIRTAAFNYDVRGFFRKWLRDLREAQHPNGAVPAIIPETRSFGLEEDGGPAWADAALICPWTLYWHYGDPSFLRDSYDAMRAYMDYLAARKVKDYIRAHPDTGWGGFGDWLALDGSGRIEGGTPRDLIGTAFYANNARIMAEAAEVLGRSAEARDWRELRRRIAAAFNERFITAQGLLVSGTQTAHVLALHFDLVRPEHRAAIAARLAALIRENGDRLGTGFVGTPYLLHALEAVGELDLAYKLLEQTKCPSWLFPVTLGATTIWERWDGWTPDRGFNSKGMNSFNHYAFGAVGDWLVSTVAGMVPDAPGYSRIRFKPRPGGHIASASARLITSRGPAAIAWARDGADLRVNLEVPPTATAIWDGPREFAKGPAEPLPPGRHEFTLRSTG